MLPRIARDAYLRQHATTMEIWGRLFVRGETADSVADTLVARAGR
jgi:hypothetical protein